MSEITCPYCHQRHGTRNFGPISVALCSDAPRDEINLVTQEGETGCRWFHWIGGPWCEGCGEAPEAHDGIAWLAPGSNPFRDSEVHVRWEDYGPGKTLNVPLFTAVFGTPTKEDS